jgi:hypothetical protein
MNQRPGDRRNWKKGETNDASSGEAFESRTGPKASSFVLGEALEYRVARLHLFMGYFVRRGCPIYTVSALDRATDLDVLATRYIEPFDRQMIIAECKSGENAPLDRIFWLSGVKQYTRASQALLVRKATKWNIKDFAKECGVRVVDLHRLSEMEVALGINVDEWPGISDRDFFSKELDGWNASLRSNSRFWELTLTLTSEIRWEEPFAGANYLLSQLRLLTRAFPDNPKDSFYRFLLTESIAQLSLFMLRIAEQCFDLSERDRNGLIRKGLTYGNLDPKYAERILESAYNLSRQSVLHYTNRGVDLDRQVFQMPEPPGTDELINFLEALLKAYPACLIFPQVCDHVLLERFTKKKEMRRVLRRMFPQATLSTSVGLAHKFVATLISIGACPSYVEEVFSRPEPEVPGADVKTPGQEQAPVASPAHANTVASQTKASLADENYPQTVLRGTDAQISMGQLEIRTTDSLAAGGKEGGIPTQSSLDLGRNDTPDGDSSGPADVPSKS